MMGNPVDISILLDRILGPWPHAIDDENYSGAHTRTHGRTRAGPEIDSRALALALVGLGIRPGGITTFWDHRAL